MRFIGLCLVALAACAPRWVDFEVRRIDAVRVERVDDDGFDVTVTSRIANPNPLGATLRRIELTASMGPHVLGQGAVPGPVTVAARSEFSLDTPVRVRYADLPADFPNQVAGGFLPLTVRVSLAATTALGSVSMDLAWTGRTRIAEALDVLVTGSFRSRAVRIRSVRLAGVGLFSMTLVVSVVMENPFAFPVTIRGGDLDVFVSDGRADRYFATAHITEPVVLAPGRPQVRELALTAAHPAAIGAARAILEAGPRFRARGALDIDPIAGVSRIPVDVRADSSVFAP